MTPDRHSSEQYRCTNTECPRHTRFFDVEFLRCQRCASPLEHVDAEASSSTSPGSPVGAPNFVGNPYGPPLYYPYSPGSGPLPDVTDLTIIRLGPGDGRMKDAIARVADMSMLWLD